MAELTPLRGWSRDKTIKRWSIDSPPSAPCSPVPSGSSTGDALQPLTTITTRSPVWRARFTPFGSALLSLPQADETALSLYHAAGPPGSERVVQTFSGHSEKVKEFVWRCRGGADSAKDDRSFQLITWGKDQTLKFWSVCS